MEFKALEFKVYIPARYGSTRLPGKALADLGGAPIIAHVVRRAQESGATLVVVATDDERIAEAVLPLGAAVAMTSPDHPSGTDRLAEAVALRGEPGEALIVNLQGDEPEMPGAVIRQVAALLAAGEAEIATVCEPFAVGVSPRDPHVVKVVRDGRGYALYFSRAPIPWLRAVSPERFANRPGEPAIFFRHVGLYAYRVATLRAFAALPPVPLEQGEALEQLRALHHGMRIRVGEAVAATGIGIDTPADLEAARQRLLGLSG
jgi:3-deoxy-manno-octulosonate cytidylyltransferase (CMP-KDO synthetase)